MYVFRADVERASALSNTLSNARARAATPRYFVINAHISCGRERDNLYAERGMGVNECTQQRASFRRIAVVDRLINDFECEGSNVMYRRGDISRRKMIL